MDENTPIRKQLLSIPNLLGYVRIILIPLIVWRYLTADTAEEYYIAAVLVVLSGLTDFLDGFVARKYHMVTPVGKLVDPIADKLTQLAVVVSLCFRFPFMFALLGIFVVKEIYMMIMDVLLYKRDKMLNGSVWCGKICTAVLYAVMFVLILIPRIPQEIADILIAVGIGFLFYAFMGYAKLFRKMWGK